jgi:hypothetical protein
LPVSNSSHRTSASRHSSNQTGMAQRQCAGLITPRSADQNPQEVFFSSFSIITIMLIHMCIYMTYMTNQYEMFT